jgi:hypothetical protein
VQEPVVLRKWRTPPAAQWMFEILTERTTPEPEVEDLAGLEFLSAEVFAGDPTWIERLEESGLIEAAIGAATWKESGPPELLPVLHRLTEKAGDDFYVWELALQLATCYREVTPRAEALGLARVLDRDTVVDVILLWDEDSRSRARIAVVHPKVRDGMMDVGTAWKWIDAFLPRAVREHWCRTRIALAEGATSSVLPLAYAVIHRTARLSSRGHLRQQR